MKYTIKSEHSETKDILLKTDIVSEVKLKILKNSLDLDLDKPRAMLYFDEFVMKPALIRDYHARKQSIYRMKREFENDEKLYSHGHDDHGDHGDHDDHGGHGDQGGHGDNGSHGNEDHHGHKADDQGSHKDDHTSNGKASGHHDHSNKEDHSHDNRSKEHAAHHDSNHKDGIHRDSGKHESSFNSKKPKDNKLHSRSIQDEESDNTRPKQFNEVDLNTTSDTLRTYSGLVEL